MLELVGTTVTSVSTYVSYTTVRSTIVTTAAAPPAVTQTTTYPIYITTSYPVTSTSISVQTVTQTSSFYQTITQTTTAPGMMLKGRRTFECDEADF